MMKTEMYCKVDAFCGKLVPESRDGGIRVDE